MKSVLGIDIRENEIRIVEMVRVGKRTGLVNFGTVPIETDEKGNKDRSAGLKRFLAEKMIRTKTAVIAYPTKYAIVKFIDMPVMRHQGENEIIYFEAKQQIPFPLEDVLWDYGDSQIRNKAKGTKFTSRQAVLVALKKDNVKALINDISRSRLDIAALTVSGLALYNASLNSLALEDLPKVVLELDDDASNLLVLTDKFWVRSIMAGTSHPEELVTQLDHSLTFFRNQFKEELKLEEILLTGKLSPEVLQALSQDGKTKVSELSIINNIELTAAIKDKFQVKIADQYSVAIGAALQGITDVPAKLNFLPKRLERLKRGTKKAKPAQVISFLAASFYFIALCLYGTYMISDYNLSSMKLAHLRERLLDYEFYQDKTSQLLKGRDVSEREIAVLRNMIASRSKYLELLKLISESAPENTYIEGISSDKDDITLSGLIKDYEELSEFLKRLKESNLINSAQTVQAVETKLGEDEFISFSLRLTMVRL